MMNILNKFKNPQVWGFFVSVVVMAVISFCYFYPDAVQGNELRQYDMMQGTANGQEAKEFYEQTGEKTLWTNALFSGMPTFQISPSYPSNSLFSWINTVYGLWLPSPSNLLFMMMMGFLILLFAMKVRWYYALIGAIAYGFSSYFIIIIGAGHIWKFVTLAYIPPTIAGIVVCYRGKYLLGASLAALFAMMQIASNHIQMSYYFIFVVLGFVIAYLAIAIKQRQIRKWSISTAALVVAASLAVAANLPNLYNTYEYSKETMRGTHSELTSNQDGDDVQTTNGLDRDYITQYSYGEVETLSLLIPNIKGGASIRAEGGSLTPMTLDQLPKAQKIMANDEILLPSTQLLQSLTQYFGEPEGTNGPVYVGAIIVVLFLIGCFIIKGPLKWVLLALTLLSVFLALGRNMMWFTNLFIDYVPMYSKFRTVESILVIAEFTMPLLAILALQKLFTEPDAWKKYKNWIITSFVITLFLCFLGITAPSIFGTGVTEQDIDISNYYKAMAVEQGYPELAPYFDLSINPALYNAVETIRYSMVISDATRSFIFIAVAFCVMLLYFFRKIPAWTSCSIIGILILCDLYSVNKRYLSHSNFCMPNITQMEQFPLSDIDREILNDTAMNYRVMDIPRFNRPEPSYHHKMIGGYHAAKLTRYQDIISRYLGNMDYYPELRIDSIANEYMAENPDMTSHFRTSYFILDMLNARYIIDKSGKLHFNPYALGNAWFVNEIYYVDDANEEMAAFSHLDPSKTAVADKKFKPVFGDKIIATSSNDTIYETSYAPNRLTYHAETTNGGIAVFSEVYFPWGWNVYIDGKPAELGRVDYILRALCIPAGTHEIVMCFDPKSIHTTTTIAYIAIIIIYLSLIAAIVMALIPRNAKHQYDKA